MISGRLFSQRTTQDHINRVSIWPRKSHFSYGCRTTGSAASGQEQIAALTGQLILDLGLTGSCANVMNCTLRGEPPKTRRIQSAWFAETLLLGHLMRERVQSPNGNSPVTGWPNANMSMVADTQRNQKAVS